jgi:hypothetical protein
MYDVNGQPHNLCKHSTNDECGMKKKTRTSKCKICMEKRIRHDVVYYCSECGIDHSFCSIDKHNKEWDCFHEHVRRMARLSKRKRATEN